MSFIIKALRKVEKEKAAAREMREVEISSAILMADKKKSSPGRNSRRLLGLSLAATILVCIALYLAFKTPAEKPLLPVKPAGPEEAGLPSPPAPLAADREKEPSPPPRSVPEKTQVMGKSEASPAQSSVAQAPASGDAMEMTRKPPLNRREREDAGIEEEYAAVTPPANLTVNGIALRDDPRDSVAVVNGRLLKSGMEIEGVLIDRIYVDRVRFKGGGGYFEVQLAK